MLLRGDVTGGTIGADAVAMGAVELGVVGQCCCFYYCHVPEL